MKAKDEKPKQGGPPPALPLFAFYVLLGAMISFGFGRRGESPGSLPAEPLVELAPSMIVLALFLVHYECYDCMGVGIARTGTTMNDWQGLKYSDYGTKLLPEAVYLAQRVQTNQVEQLPVLLVGSISCALYVNGTVSAVLTAIWCLLRIRYGHVYRGSAGMTLEAVSSRIGTYTVPAYFCANTLVMAAAVTAMRSLFV